MTPSGSYELEPTNETVSGAVPDVGVVPVVSATGGTFATVAAVHEPDKLKRPIEE